MAIKALLAPFTDPVRASVATECSVILRIAEVWLAVVVERVVD
jgi:hypothetical protein